MPEEPGICGELVAGAVKGQRSPQVIVLKMNTGRSEAVMLVMGADGKLRDNDAVLAYVEVDSDSGFGCVIVDDAGYEIVRQKCPDGIFSC